MRIGWRIVAIVLALTLMGGLFALGRLSGRLTSVSADEAATIHAVERFRAGKTTFCELNERARFYACPAIRKAIPYNGGMAVLYVCDLGGTKGFVEAVRLSTEAKTLLIIKFLESGFKVEPTCGSSDNEVMVLTKVPWKTAQTP